MRSEEDLKEDLKEMSNPGKSGSQLFFTHDKKLMLKTGADKEAKVLKEIWSSTNTSTVTRALL